MEKNIIRNDRLRDHTEVIFASARNLSVTGKFQVPGIGSNGGERGYANRFKTDRARGPLCVSRDRELLGVVRGWNRYKPEDRSVHEIGMNYQGTVPQIAGDLSRKTKLKRFLLHWTIFLSALPAKYDGLNQRIFAWSLYNLVNTIMNGPVTDLGDFSNYIRKTLEVNG